jgi:hypothetical protein
MPNDDKPNPMDDVKKGLGLLFRAAKTAVKNLPTDPIEKVVLDGAREVGRAVENVATALEKEVFGKDRAKKETPSDAPPSQAKADAPDAKAEPAPAKDDAKAPEAPPRDVGGPRVG